VTELLGHDLDIDARLEGERRRGVPRRVELDDRQPGRLRQLTEAPGDVVRVQRLAEFVGEHAAGIRPGLTGRQALTLAQSTMRLHAGHAATVQGHDALAGLRLRAPPYQPAADLDQRRVDRHGGPGGVDVGVSQCAYLAAAEPAQQHEAP
jgi:hypothetical protein